MKKPGYPTLMEVTRIWVRIGLLSFGGPAGQIAMLHRILVEEQKWPVEKRVLHALNYCMSPRLRSCRLLIGRLASMLAKCMPSAGRFLLGTRRRDLVAPRRILLRRDASQSGAAIRASVPVRS